MKFDCFGPDGYHLLPILLIWRKIDGAEEVNSPTSRICSKHGGIALLSLVALRIDNHSVNFWHIDGLHLNYHVLSAYMGING